MEGSSESFDRFFRRSPVEVGKIYNVEIVEVSRRGEGVARIQGLVVFVPDTKPGDHVRIRVTHVGRRYANAEIVR